MNPTGLAPKPQHVGPCTLVCGKTHTTFGSASVFGEKYTLHFAPPACLGKNTHYIWFRQRVWGKIHTTIGSASVFGGKCTLHLVPPACLGENTHYNRFSGRVWGKIHTTFGSASVFGGKYTLQSVQRTCLGENAASIWLPSGASLAQRNWCLANPPDCVRFNN
jgi:hypothetical protein